MCELPSNPEVRCVDPPKPPSATGLVYNYVEGTEVAFGDSITYSCEPDHYFTHDYSLQNFNITCNDGSWTQYLPWKICVKESGSDMLPPL